MSSRAIAVSMAGSELRLQATCTNNLCAYCSAIIVIATFFIIILRRLH